MTHRDPIPLHKDRWLNPAFWQAMGFDVEVYPYVLRLDADHAMRVWRNSKDKRFGAYDGFELWIEDEHITVHSRLIAAASVLAGLIAWGARFEQIIEPPAPVEPVEPRWPVWDDGLRKAYAEMLVEERKKIHPGYDFKAVPSQFHSGDLYQIEGRKKS